MRRHPFAFVGMLLLSALLAQMSLTGCKTADCASLYAQHDTVYISECTELGEDFYSLYHTDSVKIAVPEGFTYYSDYGVRNHQPGHDISSVFQDDDGRFELPQGALVENDVVFSFQPYSISGFAQGVYIS